MAISHNQYGDNYQKQSMQEGAAVALQVQAAQVKRRESEISRAMDELEGAVRGLDNFVQQLTDRIKPFCNTQPMPTAPLPAGKPAETVQSSVGISLQEATDRIQSITRKVVEATNQLCI